jgi:hypothetical protein
MQCLQLSTQQPKFAYGAAEMALRGYRRVAMTDLTRDRRRMSAASAFAKIAIAPPPRPAEETTANRFRNHQVLRCESG